MFKLRATPTFETWMDGLRDRRGAMRIFDRLARLERGLFGDAKGLGGGVSELRIDAGPGYRVYFTRRGETVVLLPCGGDKGSQKRDVAEAKRLALEWKD